MSRKDIGSQVKQRGHLGEEYSAWRVALCLSTCLLALLSPPALLAQAGSNPAPPSGSRPSAGGEPPLYGGGQGTRRGGPMVGGHPERGQHLPQWFAQHQNLPPSAQEDALRHEPGFSHLPDEQQQQLINRLHRLDMEPPAQRQRMLERNERFMALPPERQQAIRSASQALGQLPPDRRQAVRQAFHDLRNLHEEDRQRALDSARFQVEYSPQERAVLGSLLSIEPYQP